MHAKDLISPVLLKAIKLVLIQAVEIFPCLSYLDFKLAVKILLHSQLKELLQVCQVSINLQ
jgi:hypothetical protein